MTPKLLSLSALVLAVVAAAGCGAHADPAAAPDTTSSQQVATPQVEGRDLRPTKVEVVRSAASPSNDPGNGQRYTVVRVQGECYLQWVAPYASGITAMRSCPAP